MINYKDELAKQIAEGFEGLEAAALRDMIEYPPNPELGDFSLPCFKLSKALRKSPQAIADEIKSKLATDGLFSRVESVSGYVNVFLDKQAFAANLLSTILSERERYGSSDLGAGKTVVFDFSSPNIAKPFHVGHLRSTMIGNALYRIHQYLGYTCVGVNHLGDWGTQFGKLIVAYKNWGNEAAVEEGGILELLRLYVQFHDEADKTPELEEDARSWFVRLEQGDEEAHR